MGGRLHQMAPSAFLDTVPGPEPTSDQRLRFVTPVIGNELNSERTLAPIFTKSMQSVLDAAATDRLRVVDTASHKAANGDNKPKDTLNDVGIYLDTQASRAATEMAPEHQEGSWTPLSEQHARNLGRRSWHWIVVPVELEWSATSAFYAEETTSMAKGQKQADRQQGGAGEARSVDMESTGAADIFPVIQTAHFLAAGASNASHTGAVESASASASRLSTPALADPAQGKQFIHDTPQCEIALGQFAEYRLNVFTHQHRCFLYGIYIRKQGARMIYCDRTGARVSEEFDWTSSNSFLHTFVWKLAHMSMEQLGFDPTAELATDAQRLELQNVRDGDTLPLHIAEAVSNAFDGPYPVYSLCITISEPFPDELFPVDDPITRPDPPSPTSAPPATPSPREQPTKEHYFLVARPLFYTDALVGRCTKCYIAYDLGGQRFCFLKDYWRPLVTNRSRPEHLVYGRLHAARTPFIATLICGGDVGGRRNQVTQVQDNLPSKGRPVPRVHYRIAIAEIGRPLHMFIGFRHLANIFAQAVMAHDHAVKCAGVLHRDISVGNIMIDANGDGFLIDWDLSRLISELGTGPVEPERAGTWQFQSALVQRWPRKPYRASDDIESFIHAFRYMVLRHHVTDIPSFYDAVVTYFEGFASVPAAFGDGVRMVKRGGYSKWVHFGSPTSAFTVVGNPKLQRLLDDIASQCHESYSAIDETRMDSVYGLPEVPGNQQEEQDQAPPPTVQSLDNVSWVTRSRRSRGPPAIVSLTPIISTPPADPCEISGFLADAQDVVDTFAEYIESTSSQADRDADIRSKAPDEFRARDAERPRINMLPRLSESRHLSALSRSYTPSSSSADSAVSGPAAPGPDTHRSNSPGVPCESPVPSRDPSPHPSGPPSRATSPGPSVAPSSREGSPLPGVPPIAGPSTERDVPVAPETLGKRRGRTSDVAEAASRMTSGPGTTKASKGLRKPLKEPRN